MLCEGENPMHQFKENKHPQEGQQSSIFDFLHLDDDLLTKIEALQPGESLALSNLTINHNKYYEVEDSLDQFHELFHTADNTYRFVNAHIE